MKLRKIVFLSCLIASLILFFNGVIVLTSPRVNTGNNTAHGNREEHPGPILISDEEEPEEKDNSSSPMPYTVKMQPANVLLIGLDQEEVRSDVIILLNYDPSSGGINLLSVPRDTRVKVRGKFEKMNALYAFGKENLLIKGMEQLTGTHIDYYVTLNFKGFRKIIDALDGVEIDVPFNMNYDDPDQNLHIHLQKGRQVLDGTKAEQLVRYRKGNRNNEGYEDGDIGRIKMQQEFIRELFAQKVRLKYISKADDIFFLLKKYMRTNIEMGDVQKHLSNIRNVSYDKINTFTVPGSSRYINELWYFIADKPATKELVKENFYK